MATRACVMMNGAAREDVSSLSMSIHGGMRDQASRRQQEVDLCRMGEMGMSRGIVGNAV